MGQLSKIKIEKRRRTVLDVAKSLDDEDKDYLKNLLSDERISTGQITKAFNEGTGSDFKRRTMHDFRTDFLRGKIEY